MKRSPINNIEQNRAQFCLLRCRLAKNLVIYIGFTMSCWHDMLWRRVEELIPFFSKYFMHFHMIYLRPANNFLLIFIDSKVWSGANIGFSQFKVMTFPVQTWRSAQWIFLFNNKTDQLPGVNKLTTALAPGLSLTRSEIYFSRFIGEDKKSA